MHLPGQELLGFAGAKHQVASATSAVRVLCSRVLVVAPRARLLLPQLMFVHLLHNHLEHTVIQQLHRRLQLLQPVRLVRLADMLLHHLLDLLDYLALQFPRQHH